MFIPNLTKEEIEKREKIFLSFPQQLQHAIASEETADKLYNIWSKNQLDPSAQSIISFTVGEVLLGIIKVDELANILTKRLEIDSSRIEKLNREINIEILKPIMVYLSKSALSDNLMTNEKQQAVPSNLPAPAPENIIDLKNLPKE